MAQWRKLRLVLFSGEGGARVSHWRNEGRGVERGRKDHGREMGVGRRRRKRRAKGEEMGSREPAPWRLGLPIGRLGRTG